MAHIRKTLETFKDCERGAAYIEFIIALNVLVLLFFASVEVSRLFLIIQKLENVASEIADVTAQADPNTSPLSISQMSYLLGAVTDMMAPYTSGASDTTIRVIVSDVTKTGQNVPQVNWQYCGGGTLSVSSAVGKAGSEASMPNNFQINSGEEVVITEVFYNFSPIVAQNTILKPFQMYRTSLYTPRFGSLAKFSSNCG